jgi:DNA-binding LacI/PurR family transcriptional regulator
VLRARGIRAVLLWLPDDPDFEIAADVSDFSLVAAPVGMKQLPVHTVSSHHYRAARLVTRKLAELGFQRPGLVIGFTPRNQNLDMVAGAYRAEWERGTFPGTMPPPLEPRWQQDRFLRWFEQQKPDALISATTGRWLPQWLDAAGLRVPQDVYVATIFGDPQTVSNLPGAYLPRHTLLRTAILQLNALVLANERGLPQWPVSHLIEPRWREPPVDSV